MINNVKIAMANARGKIVSALDNQDAIPCVFLHGKHEIKGEIISVGNHSSNPSVNIISYTGSARIVLIGNIVSIDGFKEL